jgi:signal transduction histidine kinase
LDVLMANVLSELQLVSPSRAIQSEIRISAPVVCDVGRVQQVLSNLVKNALVHGQQDAPVSVRVHGDAERLVISVGNAGAPIAPAECERIFEPYARGLGDAGGGGGGGGGGGQRQGLGLGLYICRQIVSAHGGTLSVTSSPEEGTRFVATLPARPGTAH